MPLSHCIVHAVRRAGTEARVETTLREQALPITSYLEELVRELKHAYVSKAGKQYGQFHHDFSMSVVSQWLREFREDKMSFERFTLKATEHFQSLLSETEAVVDGHLLFAIDSLADGDSLYVFLILHNEGVYLDGDLTLQTSRFLDVRGVLLGAKVDMTAWTGEEESSYLSVLRARGDKDLTDQFWKWIGFADQRDITAETTAFLDVVSAYSETLEAEEAQTYRHKIVDYCLEQDKRGAPVVIRDLSEHVSDSEPEKFVRFVKERNQEAPEQLIPDRRQLKQYVRISGRNDLLSMSFAAECLGETIVYDKDNDSLIIRNLPAPLKLRLIKHMQQLTSGPAE